MTLASPFVRYPPGAQPAHAGRHGRAGSVGLCLLSDAAFARGGRDGKREEYVQSRPGRCAGHGRRLAQPPARDRLRRRRLDHARAGFLGQSGLRDAGRHLQHSPAQGRALLQSLRRRRDAVHAAADVVGHRAACRRAARVSGLARLRAHAARLCRAPVRRDPARHARHRDARRHRACRHLAPGPVQAGVGANPMRRAKRRRARRGTSAAS